MSTGIYTSSENFNIPYNSYVYNFWEEPVPAPQAYYPGGIINGQQLGVGSFSEPRDLHISRYTGQVFIVDSGNNRIISLRPDLTMDYVIENFENEGIEDNFNNPRGVYHSVEGNIFIADRNNNRIVILDEKGELINTIHAPETDEIIVFEDFRFLPTKLVVDNQERIFVISDGIYEGIMEFDSDGYFSGFFGAPEVQVDLFEYIWRRFSPEARRERLAMFLPTEFSNLEIDNQGFIVATVSGGTVLDDDYIRRLNPSGVDSLIREGFTPPIGDYGLTLAGADLPRSLFVDITWRENDVYSVLDHRRGRIFTYNYRGFLLYVFGYRENQKGGFQAPRAIESSGDRLFVLDSQKNNITIFKPTEYATTIHQAEYYYSEGMYNEAVSKWGQVLNKNANFDLAYTGIGRGELFQNNFQKAMTNFRMGQNRSDYSRAFNFYRQQVIEENMVTIVLIMLLLLIIILVFFKYFKLLSGFFKKTIAIKVSRSDESSKELDILSSYLKSYFNKTISGLLFSFRIILHPFSGFWELQREEEVNLTSALLNLFALIASFIFMRQYTGFIFNTRNLQRLNILVEISSVILPFFLWCSVNWALTTLMEGKGTFGDIFKTTAYAIVPFILINIPLTVISNYMLEAEYGFYNFFIVLSIGWSFMLLFFGTMTIHEYTFSKMLLVTFFIIMGMTVILFIGILFFNLLEQVYAFLLTIYREISYRI